MNFIKKIVSVTLVLSTLMVSLSFSAYATVKNQTSNTKVTGKFNYISMGDDNNDYSAEFYYDDAYFSVPSTKYNPSLSTMSLDLALSAFVSNERSSYEDQSKNAQALLKKTGFKESSIETNNYFKQKPIEDSIGVIAAHKTIEQNGKKYTLVAAATRGGGYEAEWAGNVSLGKSGRHQGFNKAAQETERFLKQYFASHKNEFEGEVKLWIAGYSRGGATANITAADITKEGELSGIKLSKENIYAYCFEPPKGENTKNVSINEARSYTNIHNITNATDIVTKVAMHDWGFIRYGIDESVIPQSFTSSEYASEYKAMMKKFIDLNTPGVKDSLDKSDSSRHVLQNFQAKKFGLSFLNSQTSGHWEKADSKWSDYYIWNSNDENLGFGFIKDTDTDMGVFLDNLITDLSRGIGNRQIYTDNIQDSARIAAALFMGNNFESDKWDKALDEFSTKIKDNIWSICKTLIFSGVSAAKTQITDYLLDALNNARIDISGYEKLPTALTTLLSTLVDSIVSSLTETGGEEFITLIYNGSTMFTAHYPELCLAWLQSKDTNYTANAEEKFYNDTYRIVRVNCEADVNVYNSNNELVAQIIDNEPQKIEDSTIHATYSSDGEKLIYLPADENYTVSIVTKGNCELNYSVNEFDESTLSYKKIVNYSNVKAENGDKFSGIIPKFEENNNADISYSLNKNENDINLNSSNTLNAENSEEATYYVSASCNKNSGYVIGGGTHPLGSFAQVSALAYEGCTFKGWYVDDKLVSTDISYRFAVNSDVNLVAKFDGERPTVGNGTYEIKVNSSEGGSVTSNSNGYYLPNSGVKLTAVAKDGYKFSHWTTSENGKFDNASSSNTRYTIDNNDTILTAVFEKDVNKEQENTNQSSITSNTKASGNTDAAFTNQLNMTKPSTQNGDKSVTITATSNNDNNGNPIYDPSLVSTGQSTYVYLAAAITVIAAGLIVLFIKRRNDNTK